MQPLLCNAKQSIGLNVREAINLDMAHRQHQKHQCFFCPKYFETESQLIKHVKMRNHREMCQHHLKSPDFKAGSLYERVQHELRFASAERQRKRQAQEGLRGTVKSAGIPVHLIPSVGEEKKFAEPGCQVINKNKVSRRVEEITGGRGCGREGASCSNKVTLADLEDVECSRLSERLRGCLRDLDRMLSQILTNQARKLALETAGNKSEDNLGRSNVIAELNDPSGSAARDGLRCGPGSELGTSVVAATVTDSSAGLCRGGALVGLNPRATHGPTAPEGNDSNSNLLETLARSRSATGQLMIVDGLNNGHKGAREIDKSYEYVCSRCRCSDGQGFIDCAPSGSKEMIKSITRQTMLAGSGRPSRMAIKSMDVQQTGGDESFCVGTESAVGLKADLPDGVQSAEAHLSIMDSSGAGAELIKCSPVDLPDGANEWGQLEGEPDQSDWHRRSSSPGGLGALGGLGERPGISKQYPLGGSAVANYTQAPQANVDSGQSNDPETNSEHGPGYLGSISGRKLDQVGLEVAEVAPLQSGQVKSADRPADSSASGAERPGDAYGQDGSRTGSVGQYHKSTNNYDPDTGGPDYWASRPEVGMVARWAQAAHTPVLSLPSEPAGEQFGLSGRLELDLAKPVAVGRLLEAGGAATTSATRPTPDPASSGRTQRQTSNNEPPAASKPTDRRPPTPPPLGAELIEGEDNDNLFRGSGRFGSPAALATQAQAEPVEPSIPATQPRRQGSEASNMMTVRSECGNNAPGKIYCDSNSSLDQISNDDTNVGSGALQQSDKQQLQQQQPVRPHPTSSDALVPEHSSSERLSGRAEADSRVSERSASLGSTHEVSAHDGAACISVSVQVGQRQFEASLNSHGSSLIDREHFVGLPVEVELPLEITPAPDGALDRLRAASPEVAGQIGETNKSDGQAGNDSKLGECMLYGPVYAIDALRAPPFHRPLLALQSSLTLPALSQLR